jgi:hypothetical protein
MKEKGFPVHLVDGKSVSILKSYTHTYYVQFIKSGKFMEIKKEYVHTVYMKKKPKSRNPDQQIMDI